MVVEIVHPWLASHIYSNGFNEQMQMLCEHFPWVLSLRLNTSCYRKLSFLTPNTSIRWSSACGFLFCQSNVPALGYIHILTDTVLLAQCHQLSWCVVEAEKRKGNGPWTPTGDRRTSGLWVGWESTLFLCKLWYFCMQHHNSLDSMLTYHLVFNTWHVGGR